MDIAEQYSLSTAKVDEMNLRLRSEYEWGRFESAGGDARKTWSLYKEILYNRSQNNAEQTIKIQGVAVDDSVESCDAVNEHFCSAGEVLATDIISVHGYDTADIDSLYSEHANNDCSFQEVTSETVETAIKSPPNKKSTGVDKVPIQLLKATVVVLAPILALCINIAINTTVFPIKLLKGRLKLIQKSGDSEIGNFRGLTRLPAVSKVFEQLLANQISMASNYSRAINLASYAIHPARVPQCS